MPLLYEPATGTESETFTSADGVVTAVTDPAQAGVLIRVQSTGQWCTVWRTDPSGEAVRVRSGDPCLLVAGEGHAYDHETRPGVAYAYHVERANGPVSQAVAVTVPDQPGHLVWVKSVQEPGLSLRLPVRVGAASYASRSTFTDAIGSSAPFAVFADEGSKRFALSTRTRGEAAQAAVEALLASGPLLLQGRDGMLAGDTWVAPAGRSVEHPNGTASWLADHSVECVQVDRPVTNGAPLLVPGWSWRDASAPFADMPGMVAAYPSMWDLLLAGIA